MYMSVLVCVMCMRIWMCVSDVCKCISVCVVYEYVDMCVCCVWGMCMCVSVWMCARVCGYVCI